MGATHLMILTPHQYHLQGVQKSMLLLSGFQFLTLGGMFLGVENNSKNFGNQKNIGLFLQNFELIDIDYQKNAEILVFL